MLRRMKATQRFLLELLNGNKQFVVPIYQRTYSWTARQCDQLWRDVERVAADGATPAHFVGSVVYIERGLQGAAEEVPQFLIIDGQQRLTTVSLLLAALADAFAGMGDDAPLAPRKLKNYYLANADEEGPLRHKLRLTRGDHATLAALVDALPGTPLAALPDRPARRLAENYRDFADRLAAPGADPAAIYRGLQKLVIVDLALERGRDDPQLIFESLNSTGLDLTQADLIRNFVLMGLDPARQERLYDQHWFPMEQGFGKDAYAELFDRFMRDFLTLKSETRTIPNIRGVYDAFKAHARAAGGGTDALVAEVHRRSRHFVRAALGREPDPALRRAFADLNTLKVDVAYPLLLELLEDRETGALSAGDLLAIVRMVEAYVFRRAICDIPTNTLNKTFASFSKGLDKSRYADAARAKFLRLRGNTRFPADEEFRLKLAAKDVYNLRGRAYLLAKLENAGRKEPAATEDYTIEHVIPQNAKLSQAWRDMLGPDFEAVRARHLHTLWNLTLTGYNSELSDRPFAAKRDMPGGFADSPLRLNASLGKLERFGEAELTARAAGLVESAVKVWPAPTLAPADLESFREDNEAKREEVLYTLADKPYQHAWDRDLFEQLSRRIMNLDPAVTRHITKYYVAFKLATNFVDVLPQKKELKITLNMAFDEVRDPDGLCSDVSNVGRRGNGDVEMGLASPDQLDAVMALVRQAHDRHAEEAGV